MPTNAFKHASPTTPRKRPLGRVLFNNGTARKKMDAEGNVSYVPDERILKQRQRRAARQETKQS